LTTLLINLGIIVNPPTGSVGGRIRVDGLSQAQSCVYVRRHRLRKRRARRSGGRGGGSEASGRQRKRSNNSMPPTLFSLAEDRAVISP
jgi:hypothetical protein